MAGLAAAAAQAGGGIAISGLPANIAWFNATYAPTGELVEGYPIYTAGDKRYLFRHPKDHLWYLKNGPFDPAVTDGVAFVAAPEGPVPTGARTWLVHTGGEWVDAEATVREVV
jgi:hypothetical protein